MQLAQKLLIWHKKHGRKDLPWQQNITPYRVWLSEIMLQQTQVKTVIPYFQRFTKHFPTVEILANAPEDHILHLWTGLGYYARARNLHKSAKIITKKYNKIFPNSLEQLITLPGIGRSTAGAILAIAYHQPTPILDGNVKRVLTRLHAIPGWPGNTKTTNILWELAKQYTPIKNVAAYTQAIMDLGATLCTRTQPKCMLCPLQQQCQAHQQHRETAFPHKKPSKALSVKHTYMLLLQNTQGGILLEKRPPTGIWGSLWCFPQCQSQQEIEHYCYQLFQVNALQQTAWPTFRHTFSHFHLDITPILISIHKNSSTLMEPDNLTWYNLRQPEAIGLAAPVKYLIEQLKAYNANHLLPKAKNTS